jgi:hypothetical protein
MIPLGVVVPNDKLGLAKAKRTGEVYPLQDVLVEMRARLKQTMGERKRRQTPDVR